MTQAPTTPPQQTLRRLWLSLTGGELGCPRKRFFISLVLLYGLFRLGGSFFFDSSLATIARHGAGHSMLLLLVDMGITFCVSIGSCLFTVAEAPLKPFVALLYHALEGLGYQPSSTDVVQALSTPGSVWAVLGFYASCVLMLLCGALSFGLAWRRLADAGCSRWHLLAGLYPLLWLGAAQCQLLPDFRLIPCGMLLAWLLVIYCRPTRQESPAP